MITLEQARAALPDSYEITDEDLARVIADSYLIANLAVSDYLRSKKREGADD